MTQEDKKRIDLFIAGCGMRSARRLEDFWKGIHELWARARSERERRGAPRRNVVELLEMERVRFALIIETTHAGLDAMPSSDDKETLHQRAASIDAWCERWCRVVMAAWHAAENRERAPLMYMPPS